MSKIRGKVLLKLVICAVLIITVLLISKYLSEEGGTIEQKSVPNIVHFVILQDNSDIDSTINFIGATCILAAYFNQNPEKILIHTNSINITGNYWTILTSIIGPKIIQINSVKKPTHVFGSPLSSLYHASDIIRIKTLIQFGGIFLDLDTFVVQKLDGFFDKDCTIGWPKDQSIGTQIVIAKPNANFLKLWLQSYRDYRASMWYYNAGEAPTKNILSKQPDLVHRVTDLFGVQGLSKELYSMRKWKKWHEFYSIHLLTRHREYLVPEDIKESGIKEFNEINIQNYTKSFGEIARSIWNHPKVLKHWKPSLA